MNTIVVPSRGLIMQVGYRLEFMKLEDLSAVIMEVPVQEFIKDGIAAVVAEVAKQVNMVVLLKDVGGMNGARFVAVAMLPATCL